MILEQQKPYKLFVELMVHNIKDKRKLIHKNAFSFQLVLSTVNSAVSNKGKKNVWLNRLQQNL